MHGGLGRRGTHIASVMPLPSRVHISSESPSPFSIEDILGDGFGSYSRIQTRRRYARSPIHPLTKCASLAHGQRIHQEGHRDIYNALTAHPYYRFHKLHSGSVGSKTCEISPIPDSRIDQQTSSMSWCGVTPPTTSIFSKLAGHITSGGNCWSNLNPAYIKSASFAENNEIKQRQPAESSICSTTASSSRSTTYSHTTTPTKSPLIPVISSVISTRDNVQESCDSPTSRTAAMDTSLRKLPAWIYCTRYSDRPSSGPRSRRRQQGYDSTGTSSVTSVLDSRDEKRPRTAFSLPQLERLKKEFETDRYLTEDRRKKLAKELDLNDSQIKIWFQNKRAKLKKNHRGSNPLAEQLMADGLYNHKDNKDPAESSINNHLNDI